MYDNEPTMMGQGRPPANLVVRQGTQAGMSFPLLASQAIIGREEGLDIVLQDPESSRRHARISWQRGHFIIEDLGSTNGTFVNSVQITAPQLLNPGDSIGIGQTTLVFQIPGSPMNQIRYQPPLQQVPPYVSPPETTSLQDSKYTQYILYGCGCLLLFCICNLLTVAAWALIAPQSFQNVTGFNLAFNLAQAYLAG